MAKLRNNDKKKNGIVKVVAKKLKKSILLGKKPASDHYIDDFEEVNDSMNVPEDVKEGHFAVIAEEDNEFKRFVVPLSYLTHPSFMILLEQAADEYGFNHGGALTMPCRPSQLEMILAEGRDITRG